MPTCRTDGRGCYPADAGRILARAARVTGDDVFALRIVAVDVHLDSVEAERRVALDVEVAAQDDRARELAFAQVLEASAAGRRRAHCPAAGGAGLVTGDSAR